MSSITELLPGIAARVKDLEDELERARRVVVAATAEAIKAAEPFMGKGEAASYLGFSVTTLERRMAESDGPPRYTDGGRVSFLRSELRVWRRQWRAGDQTGLETADS